MRKVNTVQFIDSMFLVMTYEDSLVLDKRVTFEAILDVS